MIFLREAKLALPIEIIMSAILDMKSFDLHDVSYTIIIYEYNITFVMDKLLGGVIDDVNLFRIIQNVIIILILFVVYLAIQISLIWKFLKKGDSNSYDVISNKESFYRNSIFIFIAGFFMILHELLEGFGANPDGTTYELFELIALLGLALFMSEWHKILKKFQRKQKAEIGQFTSNSKHSNIK